MMADPQRIDYPAQNWSDRKDQAIVGIVVHGTGGGLKSSLSTLKTGDGRGVSIHVLIAQDGTQYVMLSDEKGANHAGSPTSSFTLNGRTYIGGSVNRATLGIELVNLQNGRDAYPTIQLQSLGWLVNHWRALHGPLPILRHGDLDPTRRRDPYQLSTQQIEEYAARQIPPAQTIKRYRVKPRYVTQRKEDNGPPLVRELVSGEIVTVDAWYTNNRVHLADGSGFADLADLEALP